MIERGDRLRLALEALERRVDVDVGWKDLDGDEPIERVSRARYTSPMPPAPSGARIS